MWVDSGRASCTLSLENDQPELRTLDEPTNLLLARDYSIATSGEGNYENC
jgi:hypothetical protein